MKFELTSSKRAPGAAGKPKPPPLSAKAAGKRPVDRPLDRPDSDGSPDGKVQGRFREGSRPLDRPDSDGSPDAADDDFGARQAKPRRAKLDQNDRPIRESRTKVQVRRDRG